MDVHLSSKPRVLILIQYEYMSHPPIGLFCNPILHRDVHCTKKCYPTWTTDADEACEYSSCTAYFEGSISLTCRRARAHLSMSVWRSATNSRKEEGEAEEEDPKKPAPARPYGGGIGGIGGCRATRATRASERGDPAAAAARRARATERACVSCLGAGYNINWNEVGTGSSTDATKPAVVGLVCGIMRRSPLVKDEH